MDAVIYTRDGCEESVVMRDYLTSLGIPSRMRAVDGDAGARREWEDLDGQVTPLLVIDQRQIVRGLDRARVDQLVGWIGC
jgi:glutaredoxin